MGRHVLDTCVDRRIDMCVDMYVDMCVAMCVAMCVDMCVDMCVNMYVDMCFNMAELDVFIGHACAPYCAHRHVYGLSVITA